MIDYTGKDFPALYNEFLELIPQLTDKWSVSSEVDPGMVLVKLMAITGDKLNYNNDKNALENQVSYVTQRKNARSLFHDRGYNMQWYKAATGKVTVRVNSLPSDLPTTGIVSLQFSTPIVFTDESENLTYTCVNPSTNELQATVGNTISFDVYQGSLIQHSVSSTTGETTTDIPVSDLENMSITLPHLNVAQNAIFVTGNDVTVPFERVDNVLIYPDKNCFELDIDDKERTCTLTFSDAVSTFNTLNISYIITDGASGNSSISTVTKISSTAGYYADSSSTTLTTFDNSNFGVYQYSEITGGEDPETIDQAEYNYRLQLPRGDALITSSDYEKKIKTLTTGTEQPLVSNAVVTDRTTDFNYSKKGYILENNAEVYKTLDTAPNPFVLFTYLIGESTTYAGSFVPVIDSALLDDINAAVNEERVLRLTLQYPSTDPNTGTGSSNIFYWLLAYYAPTLQIVTKQKVTQGQGEEIIQNVLNAIKTTFACNRLVPGEPIDYYTLYTTCVNSDSRIQAIALQPLTYEYKVGIANEEAVSLVDFNVDTLSQGYTSFICKMLEQMILEGKIPYYTFNSLEHNTFRRSKATFDVKSITSNLSIDFGGIEEDGTATIGSYTVKQNEIVELIAPYYEEISKYGSGIQVNISQGAEQEQITELKKGTYYPCTSLPTISGDVVSVSLSNIETQQTTYKIVSNYQTLAIENNSITLGINDTISVYKKSTQSLGQGRYIFQCGAQFFNDVQGGLEQGCTIQTTGTTPTLTIGPGANYYLKPGDQLIFSPSTTNTNEVEMISFGSGTVLHNTNTEESGGITLNFKSVYDQSLESIDISGWSDWPQQIEIINSELVSIPAETTIKSNGIGICSTKYEQGDASKYPGPVTFNENSYISVVSGDTETNYKLSTYGDYYTCIPLFALYLVEGQEAYLYNGQSIICTLENDSTVIINGDGRERDQSGEQKNVAYSALVPTNSIAIEFAWYKAGSLTYDILSMDPEDASTVTSLNIAAITQLTLKDTSATIPVNNNIFEYAVTESNNYIICQHQVYALSTGTTCGSLDETGDLLTLKPIDDAGKEVEFKVKRVEHPSTTTLELPVFLDSAVKEEDQTETPSKQYLLSYAVTSSDDDCALEIKEESTKGCSVKTTDTSQLNITNSLNGESSEGKTHFVVITVTPDSNATTDSFNGVTKLTFSLSVQFTVGDDKIVRDSNGNSVGNYNNPPTLTVYETNYTINETSIKKDGVEYGTFKDNIATFTNLSDNNMLAGVNITIYPKIQIIDDTFTISDYITQATSTNIDEIILSDLQKFGFNFRHYVEEPVEDIFADGVFDSEHILNKYVLPVMDESKASITIAKQSRDY